MYSSLSWVCSTFTLVYFRCVFGYRCAVYVLVSGAAEKSYPAVVVVVAVLLWWWWWTDPIPVHPVEDDRAASTLISAFVGSVFFFWLDHQKMLSAVQEKRWERLGFWCTRVHTIRRGLFCNWHNSSKDINFLSQNNFQWPDLYTYITLKRWRYNSQLSVATLGSNWGSRTYVWYFYWCCHNIASNIIEYIW